MVDSEKIKKKRARAGQHQGIKLPKDFGTGKRRQSQAQFGALCYRRIKSKYEVLLITSRERGRWIVPKGWPIAELGPAGTAAQEAWEEAGVTGKAVDRCVGLYTYDKVLETGTDLPVTVAVFPVEVSRLADEFPEVGQRKRKWFSAKKAASRVEEKELKRILRRFDPKKLR